MSVPSKSNHSIQNKKKRPYVKKMPNRRYPKITSKYVSDYRNGRKTHKEFKNWSISASNFFNGYWVQAEKGPVNVDALGRLIKTVVTSYYANSKVFACRVELYFPADWDKSKRMEDDYFSKFIKSLSEQMAVVKSRLGNNKRDLFVRHFRVIEEGKKERRKNINDRRRNINDRRRNINDRRRNINDRRSNINDRRSNINDRRKNKNDRRKNKKKRRGLHIHALLMFNGSQFQSLGDITDLSKDDLSRKILASWASAIYGYDRKRPLDMAVDDWRYMTPNAVNIERVQNEGLVNFGKTWAPSMHNCEIKRKIQVKKHINSIIKVSSYLCKAFSKIKLKKTKGKGFLKISSGSHLPAKGHEKAKRLHLCQIELPLLQRGDLAPYFSEIEDWQPQIQYGPYIKKDLIDIIEYLDEFRKQHKDFVLFDVRTEIPDQYIEVGGKSFSDQLMSHFQEQVKQKFGVNGLSNKGQVWGFYKEVIVRNKRILHSIILIEQKLQQKMQLNSGYCIARHISEIASGIIQEWGGQGNTRVERREAIGISSGAIEEGDFYRMLDVSSLLARSNNTPLDLKMPFVKKVPFVGGK